jgi:hypothetical protein
MTRFVAGSLGKAGGTMPFTWHALLIAPLLAPGLFSATIPILTGGGMPLLMVLLSFILASIISYGVTIFLFLPSLYVLSRLRAVTRRATCLLGLGLGALAYFPVAVMEWGATGPDSGPPTESFLSFLLRWGPDPISLIMPVSGLVTAALYWRLSQRRRPVLTA